MAPSIRDNRGVFAGLGVIVAAVIVTVTIVAVIVNTRCTNAFWSEVEIYPGAELVELESAFLGLQQAVYHTGDMPDIVEAWYQQNHVSAMREAVKSGDFSEARATGTDRTIASDTTNGGSLITFVAVCP